MEHKLDNKTKVLNIVNQQKKYSIENTTKNRILALPATRGTRK